MRRALSCCLAASIVVGLAGRAFAAEPETAPILTAPHNLRSGVVIGLSLGVGLAGSSGYPNDITKIDDPAFYSAGGLLVGGGGSIFVMGALTDYLNFGLWGGNLRASNGDFKSSAQGGGFRLELFPLYAAVPKLSNLGVMAELGIGSAKLDTKAAGFPGAAGVQSFLGAGLFYEWKLWRMLGGHVSGGPSVEYDAVYSRSIDWHGFLAGGRIVFYGGP